MTTHQPAALPEFIRVLVRVQGGESHSTEAQFMSDDIGYLVCVPREWQAAALQPQPAAAVSDAEILSAHGRLFKSFLIGKERDNAIKFARAILALRPQSDTLCFELSSMLGCPPSDSDVVACVSSLLTPRPQAVPMTLEPTNDVGLVPVVIKPLTPAQRRRLWDNSPEIHKDAASITGFERIVSLTERAHSITAQGAQGEQG